MNFKSARVAIILLIFGLAGGYLVGSVTLQGQLSTLNLEYKNTKIENTQLRETISALQANVTNLNRQITVLQSNLGHVFITTQPNSGQPFQPWSNQTQVRIDSVTWGSQTSTIDSIDIRNVGGVDATLESVSIRRNLTGSDTYFTPVTNLISTLSHVSIELSQAIWDPNGFSWVGYGSYVVRVTCNTGFYYEAIFSTPGY
jgi:hypothetical protein